MCGIAGAIRDGGELCDVKMDATLAMLRHRGPDYRAHLTHQNDGVCVSLGFTRLSIIDLTERANQPMVSPDGRLALVFNGEIYNYRELRQDLTGSDWAFHTESDTEVLLAAWSTWGAACLTKLVGMFAFAVHDRGKRTLTCVRDAFGIKPLFYCSSTKAFYFASELPALLNLRGGKSAVNLQRGYDYLVHGDYDSSDDTFVDGAMQLPPGHLLQLKLDRPLSINRVQWWAPRIEPVSNLGFTEAADAVRHLFLENVRLHLRSDVPIGLALSGGIDSSAIACAARKVEPDAPIQAFSFVARGHVISEEPWLDLVGNRVNARLHKIVASERDLVADLDDLVRAQGEPFGSTSVYAQYRVFQSAKESGVTVTLGGQGADELLAGYNGYIGYRLLSLCSEGRYVDASRLLRKWRRWPGRSYRLALLELGRALFPDRSYAAFRNIGGRNFLPDWLNAGLLRDSCIRLKEERPSRAPEFRKRRVVEELTHSLRYRGLRALLRHEDRNAMRFSVENRVPFLTTRFCELLFSLPEHYLVSDEGETKSIFRAAMRGIVPNEILDRRDKIGFATPESHWIKQAAPTLRNWLADAGSVPLLNVEALLKRFDAALAGRLPLDWQIWRWVNYVRWHALFIRD